jgi:hypothetical protein
MVWRGILRDKIIFICLGVYLTQIYTVDLFGL